MPGNWGGRRPGAGRKPKPRHEESEPRGKHGGARPGAGRPSKAEQRMSVEHILRAVIEAYLLKVTDARQSSGDLTGSGPGDA
jgi:hypothetical protein